MDDEEGGFLSGVETWRFPDEAVVDFKGRRGPLLWPFKLGDLRALAEVEGVVGDLARGF